MTEAPRGSAWFVAIGASGPTGFEDISHLLARLPPTLNAVVMVVLHRPFDEPSYLCDLLQRSTLLPVFIARDRNELQHGHVYIGEPAEHLVLARKSFGETVPDPTAVHRNRTVDLLFASVAKHGGRRIIGVVLSGSLDDGSRGLAAIHASGGSTMVIVPSGETRQRDMPENAIAYDGPIDVIGSPAEIAAAIVSEVGETPIAIKPAVEVRPQNFSRGE